MKILQVIDRLNVGGAERVCIDISNLLIEKNINVAVLTITEKGELLSFLDSKIKTHSFLTLKNVLRVSDKLIRGQTLFFMT